jgi:osmoprotectant transport system permease protein
VANAVATGGGPVIGGIVSWLTTAANWTGPDGIWARLGEHVVLSAVPVAIAAVLALPIGAWIGHTGRGAGWVAGVANALRALPSLGLLILLALWSLDHLPVSIALQTASIAVLVLLAIPPLLTATYSGVAAVDRGTRGAAQGLGMTGLQVLLRVEAPIALPLVFSGLRSAYLQVVATATIAAEVSLGGLGRYVLDGLAQQDYTKMASGAILVAALAIVGDRLIALVGYLVTSPGITGRRSRRRRAPRSAAARSAAISGEREVVPAGR